METNQSLEHLQDLLNKERQAREALEKQLLEKEAEIKRLTNNAANEAVNGSNLFEGVANNLPGIVFQLQRNAAGKYVYNFLSPALRFLLGLEISSVDQILPFLHPDDRERWMANLEAVYAKGGVWRQEIRFLMPDGHVHWWLSSATPMKNDDGELVYTGILLNINRQKETEEALKKSERRWRFALEGSGDSIWEFNAVTGETFYSTIFNEMLGYNDDERFDVKFWRRHIHPEDLPKVQQQEADYQQGKIQSHTIQYRAQNKNGSYTWIMDRGIVLSSNSDGIPEHFLGVHTNIDHLKKTEMELISTAAKLSTIITNMQDGIMLEDENYKVIQCNDAFCKMFNIPFYPEELKGDDCEVALTQNRASFKYPDEFMSRRHELVRSCLKVSDEEVELANGKILSRDYAPLIMDGECKGHFWKYTDITVRKKAEQKLIAEERKYRSLIENMQVGLIEVDQDENIIYANQTYFDMSGYSFEELTGKISSLLIDKDEDLYEKKKGLRKRGISDAYDLEIVNKHGERRWWHVSAAPRVGEDMQIVGTIGACLDITAPKKLERELRQAKFTAEQLLKAKDTFLANMSHEIRTPMNAVSGMSQLMQKTPLTQQQKVYMEVISSSTSSLMVIVNDILDFSKISDGKLPLEKVGFRLKDVIKESTELTSYKALEKGLQMVVNDKHCFGDVLIGDPFRIKQVLLNLLSNAVKFTRKGSVEINCYNLGKVEDKRHILLQVKDTGRGMDEAFLKILFDKFTQEDESISRSYSGTGLGMSISKHLVEMMGGTIAVSSVKNVGTTFDVNLYLDEGKETDLAIEPEIEMNRDLLAARHILVVEDNEMNQLVAKTVLEQNGMHVSVAANGLEAVNMVAMNKYDLILMDMQMPVMDGIEATLLIRQSNSRIPIIALTANALQGEKEKCLNAGMNDFMSKPFDEQKMLGIMSKWLEKTSKETEAAEEKTEEVKPLYDLTQLREISPGNELFLKTIIGMFVDDAETTVKKMGEAYEQNDFQSVKAMAHRIKPSIDQMSIPFADQIRRIEDLSLKGQASDELSLLISNFATLMEKVITALKKEL